MSVVLTVKQGVGTSPPVTNVLPNPSFETDVTGYSTPNCTITQTAAASPGDVPDGGFCARIASTATATLSCLSDAISPALPGSIWSAAVSVRYISGTARVFRIDIQWLNSGGGVISSVNGPNVTPLANWQRVLNVNATAPALTASVRVRISYVSSVSGDTIDIDAVQLEQSKTAARFNPIAGSVLPPAYKSSWLGAFDSTSQIVACTVDNLGANLPYIRYSINSDFSAPFTDTATQIPVADGTTKHTLTGLSANTVYYYTVRVGTTSLGGGSFRTMPASGSYAFGVASCRNSNVDSTVFSDVMTRTVAGPNAKFFMEIGDLHYEDIATEDDDTRRAAYNEFLNKANALAMVRALPTWYQFDDHDSVGNNAWSGLTGWTTHHQVYREKAPHMTLPATDGVYYTFNPTPRTRVIVMDCRSYSDQPSAADSPPKTRLGATQKAWLINLLQTVTEPLVFLVSTMPWIGTAMEGGGVDHWGQFPTERTEIAGYIAAMTNRVVILSGDQHCLALDDGTNSPGGCPVWHCAALNRVVTYKGGPYSHGQSTGGPNQYAFIDVVDNGTVITATYNGIQSDGTTWLQWTFTPGSAGTAAGGTGALTLSGTAGASANTGGTGALVLAGSSVAKANANGSSALTLGGTAGGSAQTGGTGALALSGSALGQLNAGGTGALLLSSSGTARAGGTATGTLALSGTAGGKANAGATGALALAGSSASTPAASAVGALVISGTSSGQAQSGATGALALGGQGGGQARSGATGALLLSGAMQVGSPSASGTGALVLGGTAGASASTGASGALQLSGGSTARVAAGATGALLLNASALARAATGALGALALSGSAAGIQVRTGGTGALILGGGSAVLAPVGGVGTLILAGGSAAMPQFAGVGVLVLDGAAGGEAGGGSIGVIAIVGQAGGGAQTGAVGVIELSGSGEAHSPFKNYILISVTHQQFQVAVMERVSMLIAVQEKQRPFSSRENHPDDTIGALT